MRRGFLALAWLAALVAASPRARAQSAVTAQDVAPPVELADEVEAVLASGGARVTLDTGPVEIWWVKTLPLKPLTTEVVWSSIDDGTLVGAARFASVGLDADGLPVPAGIYTLRLAHEATDEPELGVGLSHLSLVLLLSPASLDEKASALERDAAVEAARQVTATSKPAVWMIDPPESTSRPMTVFRNARGQLGVVFEIPASRDGSDVGAVRFGVVMSGLIQH